MKFDLYLFDADDTLFNFKASEQEAFRQTLTYFKIDSNFEHLYSTYQTHNDLLWRQLEQGRVSKELLRVERFRRTNEQHALKICPHSMSKVYLEILPELVNLTEHAVEICAELSKVAELAIITNGIAAVQKRRLEKSGLSHFISSMTVSEECGHPKPDRRIFEYALKKSRPACKERILVIGDKIETDIKGAHRFGLSSCWYNPDKRQSPAETKPHYDIQHLSQLKEIAGIPTRGPDTFHLR